MLTVADYRSFVERSDWTVDSSFDVRARVLRYGLVGELGSVVAAVKKHLLGNAGLERRDTSTDEIAEELGDVLWYCFALHRLVSRGEASNLLLFNIAALSEELSGKTKQAQRFRELLGSQKTKDFAQAAENQLAAGMLEFADYQRTAFLTARSESEILIEICLALMSQFGAELLREYLPAYEKELNQRVADRPAHTVLGEVMWHVAALATIYGLDLEQLAAKNREKLLYRLDREKPTPLHDTHYPEHEQFPRHFEVHIVTAEPGRSQMFFDDRPLGDKLTDNAYEDDGYRFHDVMHLANAAKLGWSPVLRDLMRRKRRSDPKIDEVEDGARAKIIEEAVIKMVHSEAVQVALAKGLPPTDADAIFSDRSEISFSFLKRVRAMVGGLEVARNRGWEWEDAIVAGHHIFRQLRQEKEGTIVVNLDNRSITFNHLFPDKRASLVALSREKAKHPGMLGFLWRKRT